MAQGRVPGPGGECAAEDSNRKKADERSDYDKNTNRKHHHRQSRCVYLEFVHRRASQVSIAGSFNDWRPTATPMVSMGGGWWVKGLVLPLGRYEYRFVVDDQWMPDPNAAETIRVPDGGANSVLVVRAKTNS